MDLFMEYLVQKKKTSREKLMAAGLILLAVILSLLLVVGIFALAMSSSAVRQFAGSIGALLIAAVWYGVYLLFGMMNVEYEYIVTNNELDIDKVLSKRGRKHLVTVDMNNVKTMAKVDDDSCNAVFKNPPERVKVLNYSAFNENLETYFIDCSIDETRTIVVFQPTDKMVSALWKFNPKAIKRYDR